MKQLSLFTILLLGAISMAQNHKDSQRLSALDYMKLYSDVNCENQSGTVLEHKICLNRKFQKVDSILNRRFASYLDIIPNDSLKSKIKVYQENWVSNRRLQSELYSMGAQGNSLGILYLTAMIHTTQNRIEELELLIGR